MTLTEAVKHMTAKSSVVPGVQAVILSYVTHYANGIIAKGCTLTEVIFANLLHACKVRANRTKKITTELMSNGKRAPA